MIQPGGNANPIYTGRFQHINAELMLDGRWKPA